MLTLALRCTASISPSNGISCPSPGSVLYHSYTFSPVNQSHLPHRQQTPSFRISHIYNAAAADSLWLRPVAMQRKMMTSCRLRESKCCFSALLLGFFQARQNFVSHLFHATRLSPLQACSNILRVDFPRILIGAHRPYSITHHSFHPFPFLRMY